MKKKLRIFGAILVFGSLFALCFIDWRIAVLLWIFSWGVNLENSNKSE